MDKFQNKYRISSARLQSWDYRWEGIYFITICTQDKEHYFGEINDDNKMQLSNIGIIADILWHEIPNHSLNVELGSYVIMPNHIHGILILTGNNGNDNVHARHDTVETGHAVKETGHALSLQPPSLSLSSPSKTIGQSRFQNIGRNSVSSIIGSYKSAVRKHANRLGLNFEWQTRFHDHIIRNDKAYHRIVDYIDTNAENWEKDKLFNTGDI